MKICALGLAGILSLWHSAAAAQITPQQCAAIDDSLKRLTCFDQLFPRAAKAEIPPAQPQAETPSSRSKWEVDEEKSALDDSAKITAVLAPKTVKYTGIGEAQAFLILRCTEKTTSAVFTTNMFMTNDNPSVTIRIGDSKAQASRWTRSTNYKAVGLWSGAQAISFIKTLPDNTRLVVRIEDRDRVDAEFDLADASGPIAKIREACKW